MSHTYGCISMSDKKIPRPRNAFILFRQHHHRLLIEEWTTQGVDIPHNSKISKILGVRWKSLSDEERAHWEEQARKEKYEHEKKYPDYRYKPMRRHRRKGSKQISSQQSSPQLPIQMTLHPQPQQQSVPTPVRAPPLSLASTATHSAPLTATIPAGMSATQHPHLHAPRFDTHVHTPPTLAPQLTPMHNFMAPGSAAGQLRPLPYPTGPTAATEHNPHPHAPPPPPVYQPYYLPLHGYLPKINQVPSSQVTQATPPQHHAQPTTPQPPTGVPPPSLPSSLPPTAAAIPPAVPPPMDSGSGSNQARAAAGTLPFFPGERSNTQNWQWRSSAYPFDRR